MVTTIFNTKTNWDYGTHREEFRAVFDREDGKKYKKDWLALLTKLLKQYTPLIKKVQSHYSIDKNDSYSACLDGFYQALLRYVKEKLYEKPNYHLARHLNYYMRSACQKEYMNDRVIHIPHNQLNDLKLLKKDSLTSDELDIVKDLSIHVLPILTNASLDSIISDDGDTISEIVPDKSIDELKEEEFYNERTRMLVRCVNKLNKIEKTAVVLNLGLFGYDKTPLREIADKIGYSHTKVGQIVNSGVHNLKVLMFEHERLYEYTTAKGDSWTIPVI